jgi:hypothetical protein
VAIAPFDEEVEPGVDVDVDDGAVDAGATAAEPAADAEGATDAEEPEPVVLLEPGVAAMAAAWNAAKVLFAVGLTAKTMPASQ